MYDKKKKVWNDIYGGVFSVVFKKKNPSKIYVTILDADNPQGCILQNHLRKSRKYLQSSKMMF